MLNKLCTRTWDRPEQCKHIVSDSSFYESVRKHSRYFRVKVYYGASHFVHNFIFWSFLDLSLDYLVWGGENIWELYFFQTCLSYFPSHLSTFTPSHPPPSIPPRTLHLWDFQSAYLSSDITLSAPSKQKLALVKPNAFTSRFDQTNLRLVGEVFLFQWRVP